MNAEVELLREAARVMRERANAATPGPWRTGTTRDGVFPWEVFISPDLPLVELPDTRRADAAHIASWHPAVALAVADWLDNAHAYFAPIWTGPHVPPELAQALAVARAYLGGAR